MDQIALAEGLQNLNAVAEKLVCRVQEIADRLHGPAPTSPGVPNQNRNGLLGNMDSLASKLQFVSEIVTGIEIGVGTAPLPKNASNTGIGGSGLGGVYSGRHN